MDEHDNPVPQGSPGSLIPQGPYTLRGYYRAEEQNARAFTADGWYRSGDICRMNEMGNLVVEGRDKDMIKWPEHLEVTEEPPTTKGRSTRRP